MSIINETKFNSEPTISRSRTKFKTNPNTLTTFNASYIIPVRIFKCLPSSNYKVDLGSLIRLPTLLNPVMGKLYLDTYIFYCPLTLLYDKFEELIGEGHDNSFSESLYGLGGRIPNIESVGQTIVPDLFNPRLTTTDEKHKINVTEHSLANYLGMPLGEVDLEKNFINALPFRMYNLIYNNFFRSPFLQNPLITDFGQSTSEIENYELKKACRAVDFYSSCTNVPQLNSDISIGLSGDAPLRIDDDAFMPVIGTGDIAQFYLQGDTESRILYSTTNSSEDPNIFGNVVMNNTLGGNAKDIRFANREQTGLDRDYLKVDLEKTRGIYADLSRASEITLSQLRNAFILQHLSERALFGTDLKSILLSSFSEKVSDYHLDRPLYVGGSRQLISVSQITQTSATESQGTALGSTAGQSVTIAKNANSVSFSSPLWGYCMVVCVLRHEPVYEYGLDPILTEHDKFDYYWPELNGVGNIAIPNKYIYFDGNLDTPNEEAFGFNEYGAELRYDRNVISGYFSSKSQYSLNTWHLGDVYDSCPTLGSDWIEDNTDVVLSRCLAVSDEEKAHIPQAIGYFQFNIEKTMPMPPYSVPGLSRL